MSPLATQGADVRDMLVVHQAFRDAYRRMPDLVRAVPAGDADRAAVVCDHADLIDDFLHLHHKGEDELLWPKLIERGSSDLRPTLALLEEQHEEIDRLLADSSSLRRQWRDTVDAATAERLADCIELLGRKLTEHLAIEEEKVLTIVNQYLSAEEWHKIGEHAINGLPKKNLMVIFGMLADIAEPAVVTLMLTTAPLVPRLILPYLGPRAYAAYSKRVYGPAAV
ncbi:hemerythrin domain-containing protein [Nonomuraea sp. NPDC049400]|uniref:hemerythrin domain-containing protein n=1 Tax=Nonomuraea sp. NPDC049400 TaxID=3364352 RepID=UPI00379C4D5B